MADSVEIVLGANVSKAVQGLTQFGGVAKAVVSAVVVVLEEATRRAINFADEIGKASQKAGIAIEKFSALAYSGQLANVSTEALTGSFRGLSKAMAEGNKSFDELGIATLNSDGTFRDGYEVLRDVADVFERMPDGVRKTTLATQLFGKAGLDLIPLLNGGSKAINDQADDARKLGVVISEKFAQDAGRFTDNLTKIKQAILGVGASIAERLLPALNNLAELGISTFLSLRRGAEYVLPVFSELIKYIQAGAVYAQEFYEAVGLMLFAGNTEEFKKALDDLRNETKKAIDEIWNSEKRLGDEQKKRAEDNIA